MNKKQLWNSILQQAISGKLVPQLDSEPAVEQISSEYVPDEVSFELPEKWQWVRLEQVTTKITDGTHNPPPNTGSGIPVLSAKDIDENGELDLNNATRWATDYDFCKESKKIMITPNDVLLTIVGSIGKAAVVKTERKFMLQRSVAIIRPLANLYSDYLKIVLLSPHIQQWFHWQAAGTAQKGIYLSKLKSLYIPLPPLEEQRRIVAKLDELKPLVDQFGEAHDKLSELEADFPRKLKASILQAAMQGKLVPQQDTEPAVEQLGPAPSPDEVPFALPEKWKWVKLGELLPFGVSAQVSPEQIPIGSWVLGLEDIQSNGSLISKQFIKNKVGSNKNIFKAGNVLYGKMRPYLNKVIIADSDGFCSTEIFVLDVHQAALPLYSYFLKSFLQSPYFVTFATNHSRGQKPRLETKAGQQAFVPLPPLEEQRRIVARIEELFAEVDKMSACKAP
ncbi:MAG TPA: restriction endonuclease subunit S [Candidatus Anaerobiospirillum pullistercoris]|uniref:Restriction endonuclease subunit S n=1 Tax=Candidatus Anaerobiospirillum pullistercoris TaxID=2838452 RepID=A0A9D2B1N3_9GAMM|nr:restriction endonuclease subunit S [Candidatus Anaerobiospirillum pullistercoris]